MLIFSGGEVLDTEESPKTLKEYRKRVDKSEKYFKMVLCLAFSALTFFLGTRVHIEEGKFVHKQINICEQELPRNLSCQPDKITFKIINK